MHTLLAALLFLQTPPRDLLQSLPATTQLIARDANGKLIRWASTGHEQLSQGTTSLARFARPTRAVADFEPDGFLRLWLEPNVADNAVLYAPDTLQIFVNGRKISCRKEGDTRRIYYPNLNNREPCEAL